MFGLFKRIGIGVFAQGVNGGGSELGGQDLSVKAEALPPHSKVGAARLGRWALHRSRIQAEIF